MVPGMLEGRWDRNQGSPNLAEVTSANLGQLPLDQPGRAPSANLGQPQPTSTSTALIVSAEIIKPTSGHAGHMSIRYLEDWTAGAGGSAGHSPEGYSPSFSCFFILQVHRKPSLKAKLTHLHE
ncbi:hypothetical protein B0H19DRAFT_1384997 [Mycena capillaripes]|nr:hypothetical protein B0H19DRAFT_1384997 [Mycena capillaripes]